MTEHSVRARYRAARSSLGADQQRHNSLTASDHVISLLTFIKAKSVAFYLSSDAEIDPSPLIYAAHETGKKCFLPVMASRLDRQMGVWLRFQHYDPDYTPLVRGKYGIHEPVCAPAERIQPELLDLVFVPLVAFDRNGHRLGMGKGYYDRTFARDRFRWRRPLLVGLAHSVQEASELTINDWDVPMDMIVTEKEILRFSNPR